MTERSADESSKFPQPSSPPLVTEAIDPQAPTTNPGSNEQGPSGTAASPPPSVAEQIKTKIELMAVRFQLSELIPHDMMESCIKYFGEDLKLWNVAGHLYVEGYIRGLASGKLI